LPPSLLAVTLPSSVSTFASPTVNLVGGFDRHTPYLVLFGDADRGFAFYRHPRPASGKYQRGAERAMSKIPDFLTEFYFTDGFHGSTTAAVYRYTRPATR